MATRLYLDTHAVVCLHQGDLSIFSATGLAALEASVLLYSPAVLLEIQYLFEIGRINPEPGAILDDLRHDVRLEACPLPYLQVMKAACLEGWTRDPFDRSIVAQARYVDGRLLSRDRLIRESYSAAFW